MTHHAVVKWGVLSTSTVAVGKAIPALKRCADAEVVAIASRDIEKAERIARSFDIRNAYGSYDALLQDQEVEAVYLPLPNGLHGEWTARAARAGKHILCEKPAALSPQAAEVMIAACVSNNVLLTEGL
jgi:predicted dehydrogenase